jgi:hypothetical protein
MERGKNPLNPPPDPAKPSSPRPWRTGGSVYRTIYDADDRLIGMLDRAEDAALVVAAVNASAITRG